MTDSLRDLQDSCRDTTEDDARISSGRSKSAMPMVPQKRKSVRFWSHDDIHYFGSTVAHEREVGLTQNEPGSSRDSTNTEEGRASGLRQWTELELQKVLNYIHRLGYSCLAHEDVSSKNKHTSERKEQVLKAIASGHVFGPSAKTLEDLKNMTNLLADFLDIEHVASTGRYRLYRNKQGRVVPRMSRKRFSSFSALVKHIHDNEPQIPLLKPDTHGAVSDESIIDGSAPQSRDTEAVSPSQPSTPSPNVPEEVSAQLESAESTSSSCESGTAPPTTPAPAVATRGTGQQETPSDPADDDMDTAEMDEDESDLDENEEEDRYDCFHNFCFTAQYVIKNWSDRRLGYLAIEECSNRAATLRNIYLPPGSFSKRQKWTPRFLQSLRSIRDIDIEKAPRRNIKEHMMELKDLVTELRDRYNKDRILRTSRKA